MPPTVHRVAGRAAMLLQVLVVSCLCIGGVAIAEDLNFPSEEIQRERAQRPIVGSAKMAPDGTIQLHMHYESGGRVVDNEHAYPVGDRQYQHILGWVGGLRPGEEKAVHQFAFGDEHPAEKAQGIADANALLANGKLVLLVVGGPPVPEEDKIRMKVYARHGIERRWSGGDVIVGTREAYREGFDGVMIPAAMEKYGPDIWTTIEDETKAEIAKAFPVPKNFALENQLSRLNLGDPEKDAARAISEGHPHCFSINGDRPEFPGVESDADREFCTSIEVKLVGTFNDPELGSKQAILQHLAVAYARIYNNFVIAHAAHANNAAR